MGDITGRDHDLCANRAARVGERRSNGELQNTIMMYTVNGSHLASINPACLILAAICTPCQDVCNFMQSKTHTLRELLDTYAK